VDEAKAKNEEDDATEDEVVEDTEENEVGDVTMNESEDGDAGSKADEMKA